MAEAMYKPPYCLSWTLLPYDTYQRSGVLRGDASGAAAGHVRGLTTPCATLTTRSRDRRPLSESHAYRHHEGVGASMGFLLQGFSLGHDRYFSRSPCLLAGSTRRSSTRRWKPRRAAAFKAFVPAPSPYALAGPRTNPETAAKRRSLLGVPCLSRASTHMRLARALIAEPPFTPFGRVTSLSTGASRSRVRTGEQVLLGTCSSHEVSCLLVVHAPSAAPRYNRKDRMRTAPADAVRTPAPVIGFPPTFRDPAS